MDVNFMCKICCDLNLNAHRRIEMTPTHSNVEQTMASGGRKFEIAVEEKTQQVEEQ